MIITHYITYLSFHLLHNHRILQHINYSFLFLKVLVKPELSMHVPMGHQNMKLWWGLFTIYKVVLRFYGVIVTILCDIPFICLVWSITPLPPVTDSQSLENNPTEQIKTELSNLLENFFNVLNSTWGDFFQDNTPGQLEKLNTSHWIIVNLTDTIKQESMCWQTKNLFKFSSFRIIFLF